MIFAGKRIPDFAKVKRAGFSLLPPITNNLMKIQGRAGELDFGVELGARKESVEITIIAPSPNDVVKYATILAEWLFHEELQPLIFDDEPDKVYYARVSGEIDIKRMISMGTGTIEFVCPSPFKESTVIKEVTIPANPNAFAHEVVIENNGSTDAYPIIEMKFNGEEETTVVVATDDGQFFQLGSDVPVGQTATESNKVVLRDLATTTAGWTTPVNVSGELTANIVSDGWRFHVANWDYGQETEENKWKWRGGGMMKSLSHSFFSFHFEGYFTMKAKSKEELGKVEFYLLDANNERIARAGLWNDSKSNDNAYFWAEVGGVSKVWKLPKHHDVWSWFTGYIRIVRNQFNTWSFYITEYDWQTGIHDSAFYTEMYIGNENRAYGLALAKIQFYIGTSGDKSVDTMSVDDIVVIEPLPVAEGHVPYLPILKGETIIVDSESGDVIRNGLDMLTDLNPHSDFIKLRKGKNKLAITPANTDVKIRFRERWL